MSPDPTSRRGRLRKNLQKYFEIEFSPRGVDKVLRKLFSRQMSLENNFCAFSKLLNIAQGNPRIEFIGISAPLYKRLFLLVITTDNLLGKYAEVLVDKTNQTLLRQASQLIYMLRGLCLISHG